MDKDYIILDVQQREDWRSSYGTEMHSFALKLEGVEDWIELSQLTTTPSPNVGATLHGHTEAVKRGTQTYLKFKKVNPNFAQRQTPPQSATTPSDLLGPSKTLEYAIEMLEELTGRRERKGQLANTTASENSITTQVANDTDDDFVDLAEIPF